MGVTLASLSTLARPGVEAVSSSKFRSLFYLRNKEKENYECHQKNEAQDKTAMGNGLRPRMLV